MTPLYRKDRCQYRNNLDFGTRIWYTKHNLLDVPSVLAWKQFERAHTKTTDNQARVCNSAQDYGGGDWESIKINQIDGN